MNIHEGDANRRLASEACMISLLPQEEVPERFRKRYSELIDKLDTTIRKLSVPGLKPVRIHDIYNVTAARYIKLLLDIYNDLLFQQYEMVRN